MSAFEGVEDDHLLLDADDADELHLAATVANAAAADTADIDAPSVDDLATAVGDVLADSPDLGVKKIVALIKQTRPDLAPLTNAKTVSTSTHVAIGK